MKSSHLVNNQLSLIIDQWFLYRLGSQKTMKTLQIMFKSCFKLTVRHISAYLRMFSRGFSSAPPLPGHYLHGGVAFVVAAKVDWTKSASPGPIKKHAPGPQHTQLSPHSTLSPLSTLSVLHALHSVHSINTLCTFYALYTLDTLCTLHMRHFTLHT